MTPCICVAVVDAVVIDVVFVVGAVVVAALVVLVTVVAAIIDIVVGGFIITNLCSFGSETHKLVHELATS